MWWESRTHLTERPYFCILLPATMCGAILISIVLERLVHVRWAKWEASGVRTTMPG